MNPRSRAVFEAGIGEPRRLDGRSGQAGQLAAHGQHRSRPVREHKWSFRRVMRGTKDKSKDQTEEEAENLEAQEDEELAREPSFWDASRPTTCLAHKDNIYTFMLFMPAYQRHRFHHYCKPGVFLALILLAITACLQVGLIYIAGRDIHWKKTYFTGSLVRDIEYYDYVPTTPLDELAHKSVITIKDYIDTITDKFYPSKSKATCCSGANCAELRIPCCDRSHLMKELAEKKVAEDLGEHHVDASILHKGRPKDKKHIPDDSVTEDEQSEHEVMASQLAVCLRTGKFLDCTPPTFRFVDSWNKLDTNGDGIWTLQEARLDVANLGCQFGVPPEDLFRSACRGIAKDAEDTAINSFTIPLIPKMIEDREAIPKDYFTWWTGLAALCVSTDESRCSEFVAAGFFDAAMNFSHRASRGGIADLDTALDYCQRMLRPGGICEKTMPTSYLMYRARVEDKCGEKIYSTGHRHTNPNDSKDVMQTLSVSYANYNQYNTASLPRFKFFVFLILLAWYINLVGEIMELTRFADFLWNVRVDHEFTLITPNARTWLRTSGKNLEKYGSAGSSLKKLSERYLQTPLSTPRSSKLGGSSAPSLKPAAAEEAPKAIEEEAKTSAEDEEFQMNGMSYVHYYICVVTFFVRAFLWWYIMQTGTVYLMNNYQYDDLLMNAIGMAFVFEVPEALYWFLVPDQVKTIFEGARTCEYETALPTEGLGRIIVSRTFLGLMIAPPAVFAVMQFNLRYHVLPSLDALNCACFQSGDHCAMASRFTKAWWDEYWTNTTALAVERASWIHSG